MADSTLTVPILQTPPTKQCSKCKSVLVVESFGRRGDRDAPRSQCRKCESESYKRRRLANYGKTRTQERARDERFKNLNPEKEKAKLARYRAKNREMLKQKARAARLARPEANRASARRWKKNNPEKVSAFKSKYRARQRKAIGSYTAQEWAALKECYDYCCLKCGRTEPEIKLTPDHIMPLASGGDNFIANIQPLCFQCNSSKSNRHSTDYRR